MSASLDLSFNDLIEELTRIPGLELVGGRHNFHLHGRRFLHFHSTAEGTHADVLLGRVWEAVPIDTPIERLSLLALVADHVERVAGSRVGGHR